MVYGVFCVYSVCVYGIGLCVIYASLFIDARPGVALFSKSRLSAAGELWTTTATTGQQQRLVEGLVMALFPQIEKP